MSVAGLVVGLLIAGQLGLAYGIVQLSRWVRRLDRDLTLLMVDVDAVYLGHGQRPPCAERLGLDIIEAIDVTKKPPPAGHQETP